MYHPRLSEALAVVSCIDPDAYGTGTQDGDTIDMSKHARVMFIVQVGDMNSSSTIDFAVRGSAASGMTSPGAITGKSITQLAKAGTDDNKQAIVEVTSEEVKAQGYRYIVGKLTVGGGSSDAGVIALADHSRYAPASELDLASVDEIVA